jgi:hypothetical protein
VQARLGSAPEWVIIDPVRTHHFGYLIFFGIVSLSVAGCMGSSTDNHLPDPTYLATPPYTSSALPALRPSSTPVQEPDFLFQSVTIHEQEEGGISILGILVNHRTDAVSAIEISVVLQLPSDQNPVRQRVSLPYQHILPSEKVPFRFDFPNQSSPESVLLDVVNFQVSHSEDAKLNVELSGKSLTSENEIALYGWITNPLNDFVQIHNFNFLVGPSSEEPTALISSHSHPSSIFPKQSVPFLVTLDLIQDQSLESFHVFIDATVLSEQVNPSFSMKQFPEVVLDPQGNLLLRGMVQNQDQISRWLSAEVALFYEDQIVSLTSLAPPFPLGPDEVRGFGLTDFPGWRERLKDLDGQPGELSMQLFYDPLGCVEFKGQIKHLPVDILGFESTGSTLIIRGSATNPSSDDLSMPAVQAEIRSTTGYLQTSNWSLLNRTISQGQAIDFILGIRLPTGIELAEMEMDVIGIAILTDDVLPF